MLVYVFQVGTAFLSQYDLGGGYISRECLAQLLATFLFCKLDWGIASLEKSLIGWAWL